MNIIHVTAELFPYAKTGGLADMVGSLVSTLADNGHNVSVFMPGYRAVFEHHIMSATHLFLLKESDSDVRVFSPRENLTIYLICNKRFFDRNGIYGIDGCDFDDNHKRYIFFSKGVIEAMRCLDLHADIVHCHDWHTALLPMLLRDTEMRYDIVLAKKTVFTIHNISFQGKFPIQSFDRTDLPDEAIDMENLGRSGQINMLKSGIHFADQVTTVSPQYAREIQTPAFGCGLEGVFGMRSGNRLVGLLNGIDPAVWNPSSDIYLPACYSAFNTTGKIVCRKELLKRMSLDPEFKGPVFGMVCRLTEQKGLDLVLANKDLFLGESRLIVLGSGEFRYEEALNQLAEIAPDKIRYINCFDEEMSHLIEAGSDFFLMPSLFEPCGLNQMYSLVYGTVPLASQVGGLLDTVADIDEKSNEGTGITFPPTNAGFADGLVRSLSLFTNKQRLAAVQQRGMQKDFSWVKAVKAYEQLYRNTINTNLSMDNSVQLLKSPYKLMTMAI